MDFPSGRRCISSLAAGDHFPVLLSFLSNILPVCFGFSFAFASGLPFGVADALHRVSSLRCQRQSAQVIPDRLCAGCRCRLEFQILSHVLDPRDQDSVFVQRHRSVVSADDLRRDGCALDCRRFHRDIVSALLCRITAERGPAGDLFQRTGDLVVVADFDASLQVRYGLAQQIYACRYISC